MKIFISLLASVAVVGWLSFAGAAGAPSEICCTCIDCPGDLLCFERVATGEQCELLCEAHGCDGADRVSSPCESVSFCEQILVAPIGTTSAPVAGPIGLALTALAAFVVSVASRWRRL